MLRLLPALLPACVVDTQIGGPGAASEGSGSGPGTTARAASGMTEPELEADTGGDVGTGGSGSDATQGHDPTQTGTHGDGETDTTGADLCAPQGSDSNCFACGRSACCEIMTRCEALADCLCFVQCVDGGTGPSACVTQCNDNAVAMELNDCLHDHCVGEC